MVVGLALLSACASTPRGTDGEQLNSAEARAQSYYQRGRQAVDSGDFVAAFSLFRTAADAGSVDAVYELGIAYFEGRGADIDYANALKWWSAGAEAGEARSQYGLGYLYQQGQGVAQDTARAEQWYEAAAKRGHPKAKVALGRLAMAGDDSSTALQHFEAAAELGEAEALYLIGRMYEKGMGVESDMDTAMEYFLKAADAGDSKAQFRLANSMLENDSEAIEAAVAWLNKAAEQDHAQAQAMLGKIHEDENDRETAMSWYMRAALNGNESARERLERRVTIVHKALQKPANPQAGQSSRQ